jgi:hypothetical protein
LDLDVPRRRLVRGEHEDVAAGSREQDGRTVTGHALEDADDMCLPIAALAG